MPSRAGKDAPTSGREFRAMREQGVPQTLISGRKVVLRTVTPDRLLRSGKVPDILTPLVLKMIFEDVSGDEVDAFLTPRQQAADALAVLDSLQVVCEEALLSPRIVEDPQADDEIRIDDLTLAERGWIFKLALAAAEVLATFRYEPPRDVEVVPDGEGDAQPAQ